MRITRSGLRPRDGGELIAADQFDNAGFSGRRKERRMALGRTGLSAEARGAVGLRDAHGVATGPERSLLVSAMTPYRGEQPHEAPIGLGDVDGTFVVVERGGTPEEADGTLVMVVPGSVDNDGIRDRATEASNRVDWEKVLAEAAAAGLPRARRRRVDPGHGRGPAAAARPPPGPPRSPAPAAEREPFPWEDAADTRPAPPSPGRHSRGKTPRIASDSTPTAPDRRPDTDAGDDDGLPPLPDFLRED